MSNNKLELLNDLYDYAQIGSTDIVVNKQALFSVPLYGHITEEEKLTMTDLELIETGDRQFDIYHRSALIQGFVIWLRVFPDTEWANFMGFYKGGYKLSAGKRLKPNMTLIKSLTDIYKEEDNADSRLKKIRSSNLVEAEARGTSQPNIERVP